jgi:hypothetical protein
MNSTETIINEMKLRLEYATEDVTYVRENGRLAICQTTKGLVEIEKLTNNTFQALNNRNELLTGVMTFNRMVNYVSQLYVFDYTNNN